MLLQAVGACERVKQFRQPGATPIPMKLGNVSKSVWQSTWEVGFTVAILERVGNNPPAEHPK